MPRRKIVYANSLQAEFPHIAKQWDRKKNSPLTPADVNSGSHKNVWWKCNKGPDHEWPTNVKNRTLHKSRCPFCSNKRPSVTNSLASLFADVATQWDYDKNENLTPADVVAGSNKKYSWKCNKGPDHQWCATAQSRTYQDAGCPYCAGQKPSVTNSLASLYPEVAAQWDCDKNENLTPADIVAKSNRKVWWKCDKGPDHNWLAVVASRTRQGNGCPFCDNKRASVTNSLASLFPEVVAQWDYDENGNLTPENVVAGSSTQKRAWKCDKGPDHRWSTTPQSRTRQGSGCPFCDNKKVSVTNSLATLFPKIAAEWHPRKNGRLKPTGIVAGSENKVWWQCSKNPSHSWPTTPGQRTQRGDGCPRCYHRQSEAEIVLACELEQFFQVNHNDRRITDLEGRSWEVDILIRPERLVVEFDGEYWHRDKQDMDREKVAALRKAGWRVVRIREEGLGVIQKYNDLLIEPPYGTGQLKMHKLKTMVNEVLRHLQRRILKRKITGVASYLRKRDLTNYEKARHIMP